MNEYICSLYKAGKYSKYIIKNNKNNSERNRSFSYDEYKRQVENNDDIITIEA